MGEAAAANDQKVDLEWLHQEAERIRQEEAAEAQPDESSQAEPISGEDPAETPPGETDKGTDQPAGANKAAAGDKTKPTQQPDTSATGNKPKPDTKDAQGQQPPKQDNKSKFGREKERRDQSWKALNEEKAAWQREREAKDKELAEREAKVKQTETQTAEQYSPEQWEKAAAEWEKNGETDLAERAKAHAKQLRQQAQRRTSGKLSPQELDAAHAQSFQRVREKYPEVLTKGSPLQNELAAVLKENPAWLDHQDVYAIALPLASARLNAAKVPELEKKVSERDQQIAKLTAEITELKKLTAITGDPGSREPDAPKTLDQMSGEEGEAYLRKKYG